MNMATAENIIPMGQPREKASAHYREPFKIQPFTNRGGSESWRVTGMKRDGTRVRENFLDLKFAECRKVELTTEWLARKTDASIRATRLTEVQLRIAEGAFMRLDTDQELMLAVDNWLRDGKQRSVSESAKLDDAYKQFCTWLETCELRDLSRKNLRRRVNVFVNSLPNMRVADVTPETIDGYLAKRSALSAKSKDNDRRAVSRFFSWCIDRPRRWAAMNPCREVRIARGDEAPPEVLTFEQCKALLRKAEKFESGRLAPYVAVCLFGGLRPFEAARLEWSAVNLADGEIRLESNQTKTGASRVVTICPTLKAWLQAYQGQPFFPSNWRKDFDQVKQAAGYGAGLKPWPVDVMRHTAISHYFRQTGSYGRTAEQFGNSEAIIKKHYQGRVSSEDTKAFYALLPKKGGRK
jgi:integrase